jgi:hypothetical protein
MKIVVVELDTGEQEFFDRPTDAFRYARDQEDIRHNSVEYVAVGEFWGDTPDHVYCGQSLRTLIRTVDNLNGWVKSGKNDIQAVD